MTDNLKEEVKETTLKKTEHKLSVLKLLENGVHFGHKKSTRNPKMDQYVFGTRRGVNIINLEKTVDKFEKALKFLEQLIEKKGEIILIGTKKQAKVIVEKIAEEIKMPYVNERWIGGTFTNFKNISTRLKYFKNQTKALEDGKLDYLTKLEKNRLNKELNNMKTRMGGLVEMTRLPEAIFILDIEKDKTAVKEAKKQGIKIVALVDTNDNPEGIDFIVPANNDALSSLKYILSVLAQRIKKVQGK